MKENNEKFSGGPSDISPGLEDLIRRGAREVIQQAIDAELAKLLEHYSNVKTRAGSRAVVCAGYLPETIRGRERNNPGQRGVVSNISNNSSLTQVLYEVISGTQLHQMIDMAS